MIDDMFQFYKDLKKEGIIFCFSGPTSQSVVEGLGDALKQNMEMESMTRTASRHIFSIFVEQMQNVVHYSAETPGKENQAEAELRYGIVVVGKLEKKEFYILSGNYIYKDDTRRLITLLDKLKKMDKNELKIFYKEQRRSERREGGKGGGLGMIETARKASRPLEYKLTDCRNEKYDFISIKAVI